MDETTNAVCVHAHGRRCFRPLRTDISWHGGVPCSKQQEKPVARGRLNGSRGGELDLDAGLTERLIERNSPACPFDPAHSSSLPCRFTIIVFRRSSLPGPHLVGRPCTAQRARLRLVASCNPIISPPHRCRPTSGGLNWIHQSLGNTRVCIWPAQLLLQMNVWLFFNFMLPSEKIEEKKNRFRE